MSKPVIMPRFGMTQEDATIVRWLFTEGAKVEQGEPICEVTTDKVNMEVEAPANGILTGILYKEGDTVPVTKVIAYIQTGQESLEPPPPSPKTEHPLISNLDEPTKILAGAESARATPLAQRIAAVEGIELQNVQGTGVKGKITSQDVKRELTRQTVPPELPSKEKTSASPAARHLAKQHGIPLENIPGTGPQGRIQGWDVTAYEKQQPAAVKPVPPTPAVSLSEFEVIPLEGMRRTIAERLQASYQQAPHIFLDIDIEMDRVLAMRDALNPRLPSGRPPISITAFIVRSCVQALREQPFLNSHFVDGKILRFSAIHIGVAVALETGLIVPVIHHADQMNLNQLGDAVADLSRRAREGKLLPDDVSGGTFTISNLGMFDINHFTAILNPPQVGILAVGKVSRRFVPGENDQPVARSLMTVSLSADHRVIDGLIAARFLSALRQHLENPNLLLE